MLWINDTLLRYRPFLYEKKFDISMNELRVPEKINGIDLYLEINLGANSLIKLCREVISLFGYEKEDLSVETRIDIVRRP